MLAHCLLERFAQRLRGRLLRVGAAARLGARAVFRAGAGALFVARAARALFGVAVLITDAFGIRSLVAASGDITETTVIFLLGSAITFTPFVVATAIALFDEINC